MSDPKEYTIGWVCSATIEFVAARALVDVPHERPLYLAPNDDSSYTLGSMNNHNVVIGCVFSGDYGEKSAAEVAKNMARSFPNIKISLMVGLGGGVPARHDIRLGDIVVGSPRAGKRGGILPFNHDATISDHRLRRNGLLNEPPAFLRAAVNALEAEYQTDGHALDEKIDNVLQVRPRLWRSYRRPDSSSDRLFFPYFTHRNDTLSCEDACSRHPGGLVTRPERADDEDDPVIHYGVIASGSQLIRNARMRDHISLVEDMLCLEMGVDGLVDQFPCLAIRGICDYADTHKNDDWQGYAAMAAAMYAKDLLGILVPSTLESEPSLSEILFDTSTNQTEQAAPDSPKIPQSPGEAAHEEPGEREREYHKLFSLTNDQSVSHKWYKDRLEERAEGTFGSFLDHEEFKEWLEWDSGPLLVSAAAGYGKSVLVKYLIDHVLAESSTVCYFFFNEQDGNTMREALCAILCQLFSQKPFLMRHALEQDLRHLGNTVCGLWDILEDAVRDPKAGSITIVLDGLDEFPELECARLMRSMQDQFDGDRVHGSKLKYFLTSRAGDIPGHFAVRFPDHPSISIPRAEDSETVRQEVDHLIAHRLRQLSMKRRLSPLMTSRIDEKLREATERTYLWVSLVFEYLHNADWVSGDDDEPFEELPASVNEAYDRTIRETRADSIAWDALRIMLVAKRPLTVSELYVAMKVHAIWQGLSDANLENEWNFKTHLRCFVGPLIWIHDDRIYVRHQTAREFLMSDVAPSGLSRQPSVDARQAHAIVARLCVRYLDLFNTNPDLVTDPAKEPELDLLDYAARHWGSHFRKARISGNDLGNLTCALRISDPGYGSYAAWFERYWQGKGKGSPTPRFTPLHVASFFGHSSVIEVLLQYGADMEANDGEGRTPLWWATYNGHEQAVRLLLQKGAAVEVRDREHG